LNQGPKWLSQLGTWSHHHHVFVRFHGEPTIARFAMNMFLYLHWHCHNFVIPRRSALRCRRSVLCCPSLLSRHRAVHRHRNGPSITVKSPSRRPWPSITVAITVHQHCARAIPRRPSSRRSRRAFHHHQVAIAPSITVHRCSSPL
jgi:hypothetical protein